MMSNLDAVFHDARQSVDEMVKAAAATGPNFRTPRAPGKWSPSQIVEHVSIALEESAHVAAGEPSKFPKLPSFVRPIIRGLFFYRILKSGHFPKAKAPRDLDPASGPASADEARARLEGALTQLEQACRARKEGWVDSPIV